MKVVLILRRSLAPLATCVTVTLTSFLSPVKNTLCNLICKDSIDYDRNYTVFTATCFHRFVSMVHQSLLFGPGFGLLGIMDDCFD
jgi:hypothetical protein